MRAIQLMNALSNLSPSLSLPKLHPMALPQENKKEHLSLSLQMATPTRPLQTE